MQENSSCNKLFCYNLWWEQLTVRWFRDQLALSIFPILQKGEDYPRVPTRRDNEDYFNCPDSRNNWLVRIIFRPKMLTWKQWKMTRWLVKATFTCDVLARSPLWHWLLNGHLIAPLLSRSATRSATKESIVLFFLVFLRMDNKALLKAELATKHILFIFLVRRRLLY